MRNLASEPNVFVGEKPIKRVRVTKAVGVQIDEHLSWENHIDHISNKKSAGINGSKQTNVCVLCSSSTAL